jgi:choline dehydrogenase/4-pyridoxate dehydrogenase
MRNLEEFDYVIVGAGSAGCVLANRLTTDRNVRVLLLEAGGWDRDPMLSIPLGVGRIWGYTRYDWGYATEPEPNAHERRIEIARGKVIGGCSSINAMGYIRGDRADYDRWASYSLPGWSFADVLPYFKRAETWEDGETELRGGSGPLYVRRTKVPDPLYDAYLEAGTRAGHPYTDDYNAAEQHGFAWCQWTIGAGRRGSTATTYLRPALRRRNLMVRVRAHATRLLIEHGRAVGVEYTSNGRLTAVLALREVLLSGGAINSPQLLMLSGIGDPEHLASVGINAVVALRGVGQNLQDHYATILAHERKEPGPFVGFTRADRLMLGMARAYVLGTGPATDVPSGFMAFLKTDPAIAAPDFQLIFRSAPPGARPWFPGWREAWHDGFACRPVLLHPESRGSIRLRSADPLARVLIRQNFLSTDKDVRTLRTAFRLTRDVAAMAPLDALRGREVSPGPDARSDAEIDAHARATGITAHHPAGTCRMGAAGDDLAVVDSELRVHGVTGLRVIDASVMPDMVGGNINAAVIMIAERAADVLRGRAPAGARG